MQGKKSSQKSRKSTAKKSQFLKKNVNQKDKITNAIKKSTLQAICIYKPRESSKTKHPQTEKKTLPHPNKLESYRPRLNKSIASVQKSMPIRNHKPKILEFSFQAIKFKQKKPDQNKKDNQSNALLIQYDQPQEQQIDLSVMNNSHKMRGSYNSRIGRYSQLKSKTKENIVNEIKNADFVSALVKLFQFLDPHCKSVISHAEIDYRKLPQAVLYFLGGLFQRIRQRNLSLSQNQFLEECSILYKRSSNDDVSWFIGEITAFISSNVQNSLKKNEPKTIQNTQFGIINNEYFKKDPITDTNPLTINQKEYNSKQSNPSERDSVKSAHFGQSQFDHMFSFNGHDRRQIDMQKPMQQLSSLPKEQLLLSQQPQGISFQQQQKQISTIRNVGIRKNIASTKAQDIREQIYTKMNQLKIGTQNKENSLLKENFTSKPHFQPQNFDPLRQNVNKPLQTGNYRDYSKTLTIKQKRIVDSFLPKEQVNLGQKDYNKGSMIKEKLQQSKISTNREPLVEKSSGWVNKAKTCEKAFDELQKMREEFKIQKKSIEKKEIQRQSYFKNHLEKSNRIIQDFILEDETRILKLTQKTQDPKKFQQRQCGKYERNIDRLAILTSSRNQNSKSMNINDSLANSCRKSLQISLPVKYEGQKTVSFSDKMQRHQKPDKIEELSQKLEKYLKNNAQKIQYSKNFTETPKGVGYNKILAM